jgi:hypothetical protein
VRRSAQCGQRSGHAPFELQAEQRRSRGWLVRPVFSFQEICLYVSDGRYVSPSEIHHDTALLLTSHNTPLDSSARRGARRRAAARGGLSRLVCVDSRTSCASDEGVGARKHECKQNHTRARLARGQRTCRARAHTRHPTTETLRRAGTHITLIHALSSPR